MFFFTNDYCRGCFPEILKRLEETNGRYVSGYGLDPITKHAESMILEACGLPGGNVYFMVGGTQCNEVMISYFLKSWEGAVACDTGHINVHETGAIETLGHKVLTVPGHNGKMDVAELDACLQKALADPAPLHVLIPGLIYISYPTEYGTLYSKEELTALYQVARKYKIPLYIDGARLAYGLASRESDLTLQDLAHLCDIFYVGGTKTGALFGEAAVFPHGMPPHFPAFAKQHGAMLAKGWLLGLQFETLFTGGLMMKGAQKADRLAEKLQKGLVEKGYTRFTASPTNQQFFVMTDKELAGILKIAEADLWDTAGPDRNIVRLATCWATTEEEIDDFLKEAPSLR